MAANSEEEPMHVEENNVESSSDASASDLKLAECIDTPITSVTPSSTSGKKVVFIWELALRTNFQSDSPPNFEFLKIFF